MADAGDKTDATAQLPDEVLGHLFSFLSRKDKLPFEAVNHKFQRCILQELKANPETLKYNTKLQRLNGYHIAPEGILAAVQTLAKKAKFSDIKFYLSLGSGPDRAQQLDSLLSLLTSQCLTKVTSFVTNSGCSQTVLENFLDGCEKLSTLELSFDIRPLNTDESRGLSFPLDLGHLLRNRRLTQLKLRPILYPIKDLAEMFKQIQPNALKKLDLRFANEIHGPNPTLSLDELFDALFTNGAVLEHVSLELKYIDVQFAPMFESLARLPALAKCNIYCDTLEEDNHVAQFVPAVTSLLSMSQVYISATLDECSLRTNFRYPPGCQFVNMIRQIQKVHPSMAIDIKALYSITLSRDKARIRFYWNWEGIEECGDDHCGLCCGFYPSFLSLLRSRAQVAARDSVAAQHLPNWKVDRCKLDKVMDDLNNWTFDPTGGAHPKQWRALYLVETDKQQSIAIHFETNQEMMQHHLFSITVSCGQCLANGCMKCVG